MAREDVDLGFRRWLREKPTKAILLTGVVGGTGVGSLVGLGSPWFAIGVFIGLIGGVVATAGALLARAIVRRFTVSYAGEASAIIAGAVGGIMAASFLWFPVSWVAVTAAAFAAIVFGVLAVLRAPERAVVRADA